MNRFSIRPATEQDAALILEMIIGLARYEKRETSVHATEQTLRRSLFEKKAANALILEHDGTPIGYVIYFYNFSTFEGRPGLYVEDVYVSPEYRAKGYGTAVFEYLAHVARNEGCARMEWTCLDWNTPSHRFYHGLGATTHPSWIIHRLDGEALDRLAGQGKAHA